MNNEKWSESVIYLNSKGGGLKIIVLESANLEELRKGRPATTPDKSVMIAWTPDPVWLADKIMDSGGDPEKIAELIDECSKRPERSSPRPYHKTYYAKLNLDESDIEES